MKALLIGGDRPAEFQDADFEKVAILALKKRFRIPISGRHDQCVNVIFNRDFPVFFGLKSGRKKSRIILYDCC